MEEARGTVVVVRQYTRGDNNLVPGGLIDPDAINRCDYGRTSLHTLDLHILLGWSAETRMYTIW